MGSFMLKIIQMSERLILFIRQGQATRTYQRKKQEKVMKGQKKQTNKENHKEREKRNIYKTVKKKTNKTPSLHLVACHKPNLRKVTIFFYYHRTEEEAFSFILQTVDSVSFNFLSLEFLLFTI